MLNDNEAQDSGHVKPNRGTDSEIQLSEQTYRRIRLVRIAIDKSLNVRYSSL